jgi:hypothetical protein
VHERRERTRKAAPDAARKPEVEPDPDDAGEEDVDEPVVIEADPEERPSREKTFVEPRRDVPRAPTDPSTLVGTLAMTMARSTRSGSLAPLLRKSGSARNALTARAPESEENFRSGTPVKSPTIRTPGTAVVPSSRISGSFSTVPAGQRV